MGITAPFLQEILIPNSPTQGSDWHCLGSHLGDGSKWTWKYLLQSFHGTALHWFFSNLSDFLFPNRYFPFIFNIKYWDSPGLQTAQCSNQSPSLLNDFIPSQSLDYHVIGPYSSMDPAQSSHQQMKARSNSRWTALSNDPWTLQIRFHKTWTSDLLSSQNCSCVSCVLSLT